MTGLAGVSKNHLRSSSSTAISVFVATQYSAAVQTGRIALRLSRTCVTVVSALLRAFLSRKPCTTLPLQGGGGRG